MGLGNGNSKSGDKGSNHNYEHRHLLSLRELINTVVSTTSDAATETTLNQILNNMVASQDFELSLVRDEGNSDLVVQQIREYDQGTGTWSTRYETVNGTAYTPTGPITYLDPSAVMNLLLTSFNNNSGNSRTPNFDRVTNSGSIAVIAYDVAISNVGVADGTILGGTIKPGETLNFNAGALNNFYTAGTFSYDATGTEFIIIYNS